MKNWEIFEKDSAKYIEDNYASDFKIKTKLTGGSDSNLNDIEIYKNSNLILNVESKINEAQCGQFVVTIDSNSGFHYSAMNYSPFNDYADLIINELNKSDVYLESTFKTIVVDIPDSISIGWITDYYKSKNVEYFISQYQDEMIIAHIDNLQTYFSVICKVRPKGSGSADVIPNNKNIFYAGVKLAHPEYKITKNQLYYIGKKLFFNNSKELFEKSKQKIIFNLDGDYYRFQIEKFGNGSYYVRKLSTTRNPTVIFSINSMLEQQQEDLDMFKMDLLNS